VIHAYGRWNLITQIVMKHARVPVVYDAYDFAGVQVGIENLSREERQAEQYCLEHADGIVTKFPNEMLDYFRSHGYRLPERRLQYMDYCEEHLKQPMVNCLAPKQWHIVYAGGIAPASWAKRMYGYQQYHDMAQILDKQGIHFHIYANTIKASPGEFGCYLKLADELDTFHFHESVAYEKLPAELSQYHWGVWIHPPFAEGRSEFYWYGIGNKIATYAEAGLPILINEKLRFGSKLVRENEIGCVFHYDDIGRLREILNATPWSRLRANLTKFRAGYSVNVQGKRLMAFYRDLSSQVPTE